MKLTGAIYALLSLAAFYGISTQAQRYVGGDISLLPDYENAGAKYKDHDGKPIADLMPWLKEEGMNGRRVPYPVGSATPGLYISQCRKILVR